MSIRFIVATYGPRHAGMLLAHLHSLQESQPGAKATIYWQDVPERLIEAVQKTFPSFDFVRTEFDFAGDSVTRIASKVLVWSRAAEEHASESRLCFGDADTLVIRDIAHFFDEHAADVIFTHHPDPAKNRDRAPVNTGVILARGGAAATEFFRRWKAETLHILATPELFAQANDHALPYASPDQMAVHRLVGYEPSRTSYELAGEPPVRVDAARCEQLNEMNSRPLDDAMHIIHYKGGWQHILLNGRPFSQWRPRDLSWGMFGLYLDTFLAALARLNRATGAAFSARDFGIVVPWYFEPGTRRFSAPFYALWRVKEAAKRAWLIATGQLAHNA